MHVSTNLNESFEHLNSFLICPYFWQNPVENVSGFWFMYIYIALMNK